MNIFSNEQEIITANDNKIVLTDQRIRMTDKDWGNSYSITIFLEDISSIEDKYKSNPVFLVVGLIALAFGIYQYLENSILPEANYTTFGIAILFVIMWLFSRKHIINISSNGGASLNFYANNIPKEQLEHFLDQLQLAKSNRITHLNKL